MLDGSQRRRSDRVAAELRVVHGPDRRPLENVADVGVRIAPVRRDDFDSARRDRVFGEQLGAAAERLVLGRLGRDVLLPEAVGGSDHPRIVDLDAHSLARLPVIERRAARRDLSRLDVAATEIRGVGVRNRRRPDHLGRRQLVAMREHDRRGTVDLGHRQLCGARRRLTAGQWIEVLDGARDEHRVTDGNARRRREHEDPFARGRVVIGVWILDPVALAGAGAANRW